MQYGGFVGAFVVLSVMLFLAANFSFANKDEVDHGLVPSRRNEYWALFFFLMALSVPLMVIELYTGVSILQYLTWWSTLMWISGVSLLFWMNRLAITFVVKASDSFVHE